MVNIDYKLKEDPIIDYENLTVGGIPTEREKIERSVMINFSDFISNGYTMVITGSLSIFSATISAIDLFYYKNNQEGWYELGIAYILIIPCAIKLMRNRIKNLELKVKEYHNEHRNTK